MPRCPCPPDRYQLLAGIGEQRRRQPDRSHLAELVDLSEHRLQAERAWIGLQLGEKAAAADAIVNAVPGELVEAGAHGLGQARHRLGAEPLLGGRPRRRQQTINLSRRGRL